MACEEIDIWFENNQSRWQMAWRIEYSEITWISYVIMLKMTWSEIYQQQIDTNGGNYINWRIFTSWNT